MSALWCVSTQRAAWLRGTNYSAVVPVPDGRIYDQSTDMLRSPSEQSPMTRVLTCPKEP